ncbi:gonadotropin-releasing hormone II receptor-like [Amblyraja radiata]|uniref:gonadotropin-releasing hormone II receptor-like n=1 Tax=Amblyraja radiata TaxID=386614 RepID=UPI0014041DA2|nr:gonadotropin-releasing hormone II receptor-like [Amblyraja radiata]
MNASLDAFISLYLRQTRCDYNGTDEAMAMVRRCNGSGSPHFQIPVFSGVAKVRVGITALVFTVSAFCNLAVLWTTGRNRKRRSHVRILIVNLVVADLLVTFVVMPLDAAWNITVQWQGGDLACRLLMFLKLMAMYSCAFVTVVISIDRQSAILNPLGISEAKKKNKIMLTVAWLLSAILSIPQILLFHTTSINVPQNFTQCSTIGSFKEHWQETSYNMFTFVFLFLMPLMIMIFCYTRILMEISKRMAKGNLSSKEVHLRRSKNNIPKARLRTLKMSIIIVTSFIVCWTPYYLLGLWYWFSPEMLSEEKVSPALSQILFIFGLFNTVLDPITYGLFTIQFRKSLQCCCHSDKTASNLNLNTTQTGSFRCSGSSFRLKKLIALGQEGQRSIAENESHSNSNYCKNGYLDAPGGCQ